MSFYNKASVPFAAAMHVGATYSPCIIAKDHQLCSSSRVLFCISRTPIAYHRHRPKASHWEYRARCDLE